ncbi:MAG: 50S ribosomal protein L15 [Desulfovibrionaceae bacterium]|nr:50S ribosomal protein L15 [Desulfovibrionaceae bacterium]
MRLNDLYPFPEERKTRKRVGRGAGSGLGGTAGKGHKGQNARAGGGVRPGFEGGQMPLQRRLPKRGFKNFLFKVTYAVVNLDRLQAAFGDKKEITLEDIYDRGLCRFGAPVKILGGGELKAALTVEAHRFSSAAADKIRKAGGEVRELCADVLCDGACGEAEEAEPSSSGE